jgi:hypothetical protein
VVGPHRCDTECLGEECLADPDGTDEDHVLTTGKETKGEDRLKLLTIDLTEWGLTSRNLRV